MVPRYQNKEIALRQNGPYPDVPAARRPARASRSPTSSSTRVRLARSRCAWRWRPRRTNPRQDLGKLLLSLGFISGADLAQAQAQRLGLDYVELTERDVDRDVVSLVPERVLRKHGAIPLRISRTRHLVVAMSDPSNLYALEDLRIISGYQITPVVATEDEIRNTQAKIFATGEQITKILEEAAGDGAEDDVELDLGIEAGPDEKPIIRLVTSVLQHAVGDGASDIHIEPQAREVTVRFRVDGVLREVMSIPPKLQHAVTARLKLLGELNIAEKRVPQDGRFSVKLNDQKIDFRVASLPTAYGEKVVLRLLDTAAVDPDLQKLGFVAEGLRALRGRLPQAVRGHPGYGADGLGQVHDALRHPQRAELPGEEHHNRRGPRRVQDTRPQPGPDQPQGRPDLRLGPEEHPARRPRRGDDRRDTRHGDGQDQRRGRPDGPPGPGHAAHQRRPRGPEPPDRHGRRALPHLLGGRLRYRPEAREEALRAVQGARRDRTRDPGRDGVPVRVRPRMELRFHKAVGCRRCGGSGYRGRTGDLRDDGDNRRDPEADTCCGPRRVRSAASPRARGWCA